MNDYVHIFSVLSIVFSFIAVAFILLVTFYGNTFRNKKYRKWRELDH